jgi:hypothetical protein
MVVHVLISDEGKLLGLFTSGVDAHEVHKQYPRSTVVVGGLRSDTFIPRISNLILRDLSG